MVLTNNEQAASRVFMNNERRALQRWQERSDRVKARRTREIYGEEEVYQPPMSARNLRAPRSRNSNSTLNKRGSQTARPSTHDPFSRTNYAPSGMTRKYTRPPRPFIATGFLPPDTPVGPYDPRPISRPQFGDSYIFPQCSHSQFGKWVV